MSHYHEGWEANAIGKPKWQNPYPRHTVAHLQWDEGYEAFQETMSLDVLKVNQDLYYGE